MDVHHHTQAHTHACTHAHTRTHTLNRLSSLIMPNCWLGMGEEWQRLQVGQIFKYSIIVMLALAEWS